jgi:hypothetical protein
MYRPKSLRPSIGRHKINSKTPAFQEFLSGRRDFGLYIGAPWVS